MKRYLGVLLLLGSSLSLALTPVTIDSASINYTTHTLSVVGSGFCTGALPAVTFNTTRLKVTSACSSSVVVASLPVQAAGSYRLIIVNSGGASATFYVTYGAVGPQGATGPVGPKGATGLTGATGPQGAKGATGLTGATGAQGIAGQQGLKGETGAPGATGATGATGAQGLPGATGATGAQGLQGIQGVQGTAGTNGTNGTGFNYRGAYDPTQSYAPNDVVTDQNAVYIAISNVPAARQGIFEPATADPGYWNLFVPQGATGPAGPVGATVSLVPAGVTCPVGGISLTDVNGNVTYVCNGLPGLTGAQGIQGIPGATGATGAQGIQGVAGANGAQGAVGPQGVAGVNGTGFNYTGQWSSTQSYNVNDVATFNGTSYIALVANSAKEPDQSSNVDVFTLTQITGAPPGNDQNIPGVYVWSLPFGTMCTGHPCKLVVNGTYNGTPLSFTVTFYDPLVCCGNPWGSLGDSLAATQMALLVNGLDPCCQANSQYAAFATANSIYNPASNEPYNTAVVVTPGTYQNTYDGSSTLSIASGVTWSVLAQAGQAGAPGAAGPQGPIGLSVQGPAGPQGPTGATGAQGPAGQAGPAFYSLSGTLASWFGPMGSTNQYGVYSNSYGVLMISEYGNATVQGAYAATAPLPGSGEYFATATIMWANTPAPITGGTGNVNIECLFAPANGDTGNPSVTTNAYSGTIIPGGSYTTLIVTGIVAGGQTPSINCNATGANEGLAFSWLGQFLVTYTPVVSLTKF
jgi:collagen type I alpha